MLELRLKFGDGLIDIDTVLTKKFYHEQVLIKNDCSCGDCAFFVDRFTKFPFEIFNILARMGVDLTKNLTSEPTGVWCIRDDTGVMNHCQQVLRVIGKIVGEDKILYKKIEYGYQVNSEFEQINSNEIDIELNFSIVPNALRWN